MTGAGFRLLAYDNPSELAEWLTLWDSWPEREVFANPHYVNLYADRGARAFCAACRAGDTYVLYPFLLRDLAGEPYHIPGTAFDIASAYGYSGPFRWGPRPDAGFVERFWQELESWARDNGVASEFVRFSLFPNAMLDYPGRRWLVADHVVRSLDTTADEMWMEFDHKVRKNVKKATRSGLRIEVDETGAEMETFLKIYQATMDRREARADYYFPRQYFESLPRLLPGQFAYFHAVHAGAIVSTELALVSTHSIYSFLGGTYEQFFELRPNDLLKFELIKWGIARGKQSLVLGGGYQKDDGIFRYKLAFAPNGRRPYCLGGRIFRQDLYNALVESRAAAEAAEGRSWEPRAGFFPAYRS